MSGRKLHARNPDGGGALCGAKRRHGVLTAQLAVETDCKRCTRKIAEILLASLRRDAYAPRRSVRRETLGGES